MQQHFDVMQSNIIWGVVIDLIVYKCCLYYVWFNIKDKEEEKRNIIGWVRLLKYDDA